MILYLESSDSGSESEKVTKDQQNKNIPNLKTLAEAILKSELLCFFPEERVNRNGNSEESTDEMKNSDYECLNLLRIPPF